MFGDYSKKYIHVSICGCCNVNCPPPVLDCQIISFDEVEKMPDRCSTKKITKLIVP
jgi:hypothetical protein